MKDLQSQTTPDSKPVMAGPDFYIGWKTRSKPRSKNIRHWLRESGNQAVRLAAKETSKRSSVGVERTGPVGWDFEGRPASPFQSKPHSAAHVINANRGALTINSIRGNMEICHVEFVVSFSCHRRVFRQRGRGRCRRGCWRPEQRGHRTRRRWAIFARAVERGARKRPPQASSKTGKDD